MTPTAKEDDGDWRFEAPPPAETHASQNDDTLAQE
jgi:hypothetical protein